MSRFSFSTIFKANPYHDKRGWFSTKTMAHFVSVGGLFDRQRALAEGGALSRPNSDKFDFDKESAALNKMGIKFTVNKADWMKYSPNVSPTNFVNALVGADGFKGRGWTARVYHITNVGFKFSAENIKVHGALANSIERTFDFSTKDVHHDYLVLDRSHRGSSGGVKELFRNSIPMYKELGMNTISVFANIDAGAYAWGRYGFDPTSPSKYTKNVYDTLLGRLDMIKRVLNGGDIPRPIKEEVTAITRVIKDHGKAKTIARVLSAMKTPALDKFMEVNKMFDVGKKKFMQTVIQTSWYGTLDLNNKDQLDHLNDYIGN